jgi:hypothetical protein
MILAGERNQRGDSRNQAEANGYGPPGGYAIPRRPIRVVLARDEEAAGIESETTKFTPPAYGLWRESVVGPSFPTSLPNYFPLSLSNVSFLRILTSSRENSV